MHKLQRDTGARVRQVFVPAEEPTLPETVPEPVPAPNLPPVKPRQAELPVSGRGESPGPPLVGGRSESATPPALSRVDQEVSPNQGLSRADIVHGYEYEKDRYVQFEPGELERIAPRNSPDMQILEFVKFAEVDPVYLETSYYVVPDAGGDKPYALLFEALKKTGYAAIGEMVMYRRDQIIVLRPGQRGLIAHTLFYADEVKQQNEHHVATGLVAEKEMDLAIKLVDALAGTFEPEKFKDQYRERLRQAISEKVESGAITQPESAVAKAPVVDIMAALRESLSRVKKPVASESRPGAGKRTRRVSGK